MESLNGQVAIISGGAGDIGKAIAYELAGRGAQISLGDLKELEEIAPFLESLKTLFNCRVLYRQVDVSDCDQVDDWVKETEETFGAATLIIPNAAIITRKSVLEMTSDEWQHEFAVNVNGAFQLAQLAAKRLVRHRLPGKIVFSGSWAAHRPNPAIPAYCASKSAIRMLCKVMAIELAGHGILVNEVAPGIVNAGLSKDNTRNPQFAERLQEQIPVQTWIEPEEVAWNVANLCDPRNRNTTGTVVVVDGGLSSTSKWNAPK